MKTNQYGSNDIRNIKSSNLDVARENSVTKQEKCNRLTQNLKINQMYNWRDQEEEILTEKNCKLQYKSVYVEASLYTHKP